MRIFKKASRLILCALTAFTLSALSVPDATRASGLTAIAVSLSSYMTHATATYGVSFTTTDTATLHEIEIRFSVSTGGGGGKPANMSLANVAVANQTGLGSGWVLDLSQHSTGRVILNNTTGDAVAGNTAVSLDLQSITNGAIDDCQPTSNYSLTDTCYMQITTYSSFNDDVVDIGQTTYTLREEPYITFEVTGTGSGETHNGVTTTGYSTVTTLPFGTLLPGVPKYLAQELRIETNTPRGYNLYASTSHQIEGSYTTANIDGFAPVNVTWDTPGAWSSPTGTAGGVDSGWLGANTSDTRIGTWGNSSGKFGPITAIPHIVAHSDGPDLSGTTVFVTYGIEINNFQPADIYSGKLIYDLQSAY